MADGLLVSLPTESIAIRAIIASVAAVLLGRLLLRAGLRMPGARVATAIVPPLSLIAVVALFWGSLRLPQMMLAVEAVNALPIPVRNGYLHFAPIAAPLLVGGWALVAGVRLHRRWRDTSRVRRHGRSALADTTTPPRVRNLVAGLAAVMHVPTPPVAIVDTCDGGATVVGIRRPVIVLDARLLGDLDDHELEGVLAHELAHVKRRDNLVAWGVGAVRDLTFFVPGGRWALRQLHTERELAADQAAVRTTGRPGALASGLLKVLEGPTPAGAAGLAPRGTLVRRVETLIDDTPSTGRMRGGLELVALGTVLSLAVGAAVQIPELLAGSSGQRDAMAVVWSSLQPGAAAAGEGEARVFDVYRRSSLAESSPAVASTTVIDDDPDEVLRSTLAACAADAAACPDDDLRPSLGLQPREPTIREDEDLVSRWRVEPFVTPDGDGIGLYWLRLRQTETPGVQP